jgi:uncharacterized membrane protein (UPF0182 family)
MTRSPILIALLVLFVGLPLSGQALTLYTDWLWFHEVGFAPVFTTILSVKAVLALAGGAAVFLLLYANLRLTARARGRAPELEEWPPSPSARLPAEPSRRVLAPVSPACQRPCPAGRRRATVWARGRSRGGRRERG